VSEKWSVGDHNLEVIPWQAGSDHQTIGGTWVVRRKDQWAGSWDVFGTVGTHGIDETRKHPSNGLHQPGLGYIVIELGG
jgi:hypothetical protein